MQHSGEELVGHQWKLAESIVGVDVGSCFFVASRRRHTRLQGDWSSDVCSSDLGELFAHEAFLLQVSDPEAYAADLVGVGGADAAPGGAEAVIASHLFFELVEEGVVAHDHVGALADDEVLGLDAALSELGDLFEEDDRVDDDAVADDAGAVGIENAARDELEFELAVLGDDGVARVVAALGADDHVGLGGEVVDDLALALVAPLAADQDDDQGALFSPGLGPPRLQVVEAGVVAPELELDRPGGAVAVLSDVDFGDSGLLVGFVVLGSEQEHDHVGVLLDGAGLTKVAENGSLVRALLWRPAQLRNCYHRDPKLASKTLQCTGDRRDFLDAVVVAAGTTVHELQIVDQDHVYVVPHLRLACFQLKSQLVHHWSVIDVDRCFAQRPERIRHAVEFRLGKKTAMHSLRIDLRLLCKEAFGQLLFGHLETENRD